MAAILSQLSLTQKSFWSIPIDPIYAMVILELKQDLDGWVL